MKLIIICLFLFISLLNAKNYTLYIASSKYIEVANKYYGEIKKYITKITL